MRRIVCVLAMTSVLLAGAARAEETVEKAVPTAAETTLTAVGQQAPDYTVATIDGGTFNLSAQKGRVVLVNWFATWCPPCQEEMPFLQKDVWEKFAAAGLVMVSIAREENVAKVKPFVAERGLTWKFAVDPERLAYARYAEAYIPRNQVIGRDGTILFQSEGFEKDEFAAMIAVIAAALAAE